MKSNIIRYPFGQNNIKQYNMDLNENDRLLKATEVKEMLQISSTALWNYVNNGLLKCHTIGNRTVRFKRSEVLEILKPKNL